MQILAIILARGGSKGLKNKNILPLCGKPVVQYTIEYAKAHSIITRIMLSSDSREILEIGKKCGVETDLRPTELAGDDVHIADVIKELYERKKKQEGYDPNYIVVLYGNVPLRPYGLVDKAIDMLVKTKCDVVTAVQPVGKYHPFWLSKLSEDSRIMPYVETDIYRRQDLPPLYIDSGGILVFPPENLYKRFKKSIYSRYGEDVRAIVVESWDVIDVDNFLDLKVAEALINHRRENAERIP